MNRTLFARGGALGDFILTLPRLAAAIDAGADVACAGRFAPLLPRVSSRRPRRVWDLDRVESLWMYGGLSPEPYTSAWAFNPTLAAGLRGAGIADVQELSPLPPPGVPAWVHFGGGLPRLSSARSPIQRLVVISPGSGGTEKRAPLERWVAVHEGIRRASPEVEIVWVAGPVEAGEAWPVSPLRPDLLETVDLAAHAACWLGPDSGPGHLAAAAMRGARGTEAVAVGVTFSVTDPAVWAPPGATTFGAGTTTEEIVAWVCATLSRQVPDEV